MKVKDRKGRGRLVEVGTWCESCENPTETIQFDKGHPMYVCSECGEEKIPKDPKKTRKQIRKRGAIVWGILFGLGFLGTLFVILCFLLLIRGIGWAIG